MKIGVFGDSFATKNYKSIWWEYLSDYGHTIKSFGESGSSIIFSAKKILENHQDYDFIIWCVTSPNRITVWHRADYTEISVHVTGRRHVNHKNPIIQHKIDVTKQYLLHAHDGPDGDFAGRCVIEYVRNMVSNILIIPCFGAPIYNDDDSEFTLYGLCKKETQYYFPHQEISEIYDKFIDIRSGHFTESTHQVLAEKISVSLRPGIFTCGYEEFPVPTTPIDQAFEKIKN